MNYVSLIGILVPEMILVFIWSLNFRFLIEWKNENIPYAVQSIATFKTFIYFSLQIRQTPKCYLTVSDFLQRLYNASTTSKYLDVVTSKISAFSIFTSWAIAPKLWIYIFFRTHLLKSSYYVLVCVFDHISPQHVCFTSQIWYHNFLCLEIHPVSGFCPDFVRILSGFCPDFVRILSGFSWNFQISILSIISF